MSLTFDFTKELDLIGRKFGAKVETDILNGIKEHFNVSISKETDILLFSVHLGNSWDIGEYQENDDNYLHFTLESLVDTLTEESPRYYINGNSLVEDEADVKKAKLNDLADYFKVVSDKIAGLAKEI